MSDCSGVSPLLPCPQDSLRKLSCVVVLTCRLTGYGLTKLQYRPRGHSAHQVRNGALWVSAAEGPSIQGSAMWAVLSLEGEGPGCTPCGLRVALSLSTQGPPQGCPSLSEVPSDLLISPAVLTGGGHGRPWRARCRLAVFAAAAVCEQSGAASLGRTGQVAVAASREPAAVSLVEDSDLWCACEAGVQVPT